MISRRNLGTAAVLASAAIGLAYEVAAQAPHVAMPAQAEALPADLLRRMQEDPNTPVAGNSLGAVTVTEFFDYRCPYCRTMQPVLEKLVAKDRRVRLVFKDWPIFGGISVYAARVAIASQWQGKYAAVHKALFALPRAMDEAAVRKAASAPAWTWHSSIAIWLHAAQRLKARSTAPARKRTRSASVARRALWSDRWRCQER